MRMLERYDDLSWHRQKEKVYADHTVSFSYGDDEVYEVDVGDVNKAELDKFMGELKAAGRLVILRRRQRAGPEPSSRKLARSRNKKIREWVSENDIRHPKDPARMAYETPSRHFYAYPWLVRMWEERDDRLGSDRPA